MFRSWVNCLLLWFTDRASESEKQPTTQEFTEDSKYNKNVYKSDLEIFKR